MIEATQSLSMRDTTTTSPPSKPGGCCSGRKIELVYGLPSPPAKDCCTTANTEQEDGKASPSPKSCCAGKKRKIEELIPDLSTEQKSVKKRSQGIVVDGQTYTCAACRSGHRVALCKHAHERPMMPTNPPGRPAAGTKKSGACDCPKNCGCKKGNCKCPRDCACTQEMYLLVYIPDSEETRDGESDGKEGTWKLGQKVMTDLKGNTLTDEEVARRQARKEAQKCCKAGKSTKKIGVPDIPSLPKQVEIPQASPTPQTPEQQQVLLTPQPKPAETQPLANHHCSCGAACSCAFCPQHPNNSVSKGLVRQQAIFSSQQQFPQSQDFVRLDASSVQFSPDRSCMGFKPSFAIGHYSVRPGAGDFQRAFPMAAGGYMLAYPMWDMSDHAQTPIEQVLSPPIPTQTEPLPLNPTWPHEPSYFADDLTLDQSQNMLEVGNAFIARNDLGNWNEPFDFSQPVNNGDFSTLSNEPQIAALTTQTGMDIAQPADGAALPSLIHSNPADSIGLQHFPNIGLPLQLSQPPAPMQDWVSVDFQGVQGYDPNVFRIQQDNPTPAYKAQA